MRGSSGWPCRKNSAAPVVVAGAEQPVTAADSGGRRLDCALRLAGDPLGRGQPLVVPAVVVTGDDALNGGQHFAGVGAAVGGVAEDSLSLVPELLVVGKEDWVSWTPPSEWHSTEASGALLPSEAQRC